MDRAEMLRLGVSYEMLLGALEEVGGEISMSGRYQITDAIRQSLRKLFKTK
jgi:hypothetical protein